MNAHELASSLPVATLRRRSVPTRALTSRGFRPTLIDIQHLIRLAIVYVRQSDPQQVVDHKESRERQYGLVDYVVSLGWPKDRILIIDEDQGRSDQSADWRPGFQRLLAEVTMDHVGLIVGIETSRIARCGSDWHHLLEMCAVFGTLLADEDGIYDPGDSNDRLLLGLKGNISEYEIVIMHNRLQRARLSKARKGELILDVPWGYVKLPTGSRPRP
jgi:DNA invertase Pin-like site-specific DNA recombinase